MTNPEILVFGGSTRTGSFSAKLAALAAKELALIGADVTLISLGDYPLPIYNADIEKNDGFPDNAHKLAILVARSQGLFIATPEYNHSLPPLLKNAIDWVSRPKLAAEHKHRGRVIGIASTSNGIIGGARALLELRKVLVTALQAIVIPQQMSLSFGGEAFREDGYLVEEKYENYLRSVCQALYDLAARIGPVNR